MVPRFWWALLTPPLDRELPPCYPEPLPGPGFDEGARYILSRSLYGIATKGKENSYAAKPEAGAQRGFSLSPRSPGACRGAWTYLGSWLGDGPYGLSLVPPGVSASCIAGDGWALTLPGCIFLPQGQSPCSCPAPCMRPAEPAAECAHGLPCPPQALAGAPPARHSALCPRPPAGSAWSFRCPVPPTPPYRGAASQLHLPLGPAAGTPHVSL